MEGKLGLILTLSWLVGAKFGAKRGTLTSTWRLRGTRLEFKGAFGATKAAPRGLKRVRGRLTSCEGAARPLSKGGSGAALSTTGLEGLVELGICHAVSCRSANLAYRVRFFTFSTLDFIRFQI